jgi:hypothetical protein
MERELSSSICYEVGNVKSDPVTFTPFKEEMRSKDDIDPIGYLCRLIYD